MKRTDYYVLMAVLFWGAIWFHYLWLMEFSVSCFTLFIYKVKDLFNLENTDVDKIIANALTKRDTQDEADFLKDYEKTLWTSKNI